jgi:hypothetical protein
MQDDPRHITPVGAVRIRVPQAKIGYEVFLIVQGEDRFRRRGIGDIGIERRLLHGA